MAELVNTFSWSISAAKDFAECPRKRYWAKYAMWGGWKQSASALQRSAYRLTKMENRFSVLGNAVELAVVWALRSVQQGGAPAPDQAYAEAARPFLNKCWLESRRRFWEQNPKKFCCLHEHYYPSHHKTPENEMISEVAEQARVCISNFMIKTLPRLAEVKAEFEIPIARIERGDPESMEIDGVKVYAIPDYAYRKDGQFHIHDWKSGKPKPSHAEQMALYGVWANVKHGAEAGSIHAHLEYLRVGEVCSADLTEADAQKVRESIKRSVGDMSAYLAGGDIVRNLPLPGEEWEMSADPEICRKCNFYELCEPELRA